jgi:hypothetical protein
MDGRGKSERSPLDDGLFEDFKSGSYLHMDGELVPSVMCAHQNCFQILVYSTAITEFLADFKSAFLPYYPVMYVHTILKISPINFQSKVLLIMQFQS